MANREHDTVDDEMIRDMLADPNAGSWDGDTYTPKLSAVADLENPMNLVTFFAEHGGKNRLNLP